MEIKYRFWNTDYTQCSLMEYGDTSDLKFVQRSIGKKKMLSTKLHDKNGKEIYEGDIVKFWGGVGKVIYFSTYASFRIEYTENDLFDLNLNADIEVIGNVFENPELLTP